MNPKFASKALSATALILASSSLTQAANFTTDTVGVINTNTQTILEATGNSLNVTTFASDLATAFSNDIGGVWNFNTGFDVAVGETITLNYGTSQANSLVMTLGGTNGINQANTGNMEATSGGPAGSMLGLAGDASTRTFTLDTPLLTVGLFNTNRGDAGRTTSLTVTFQDTTTASTSLANAGAYYFHGLSGTAINPIVSFSLTQSNFVRYDDLGFIVASPIPEPASAAALVGVAAVGFVALRRRRSKA